MNLASHLTHPVFKRVGELADEQGQRAFVIGGFVRDLLLDRPCKDIDIVTEGSGIDLARAPLRAWASSKSCLQEFRHRHVQGRLRD